jgi:sensor histidine kinase regulating citrate/malate metabolism
MASLKGKKRRRIKEPTDSMRKYYGDQFVRNQSKWIRRSKLEPSHLGNSFTFEKEEAILLGSMTSEEVLVHFTESDEYIVIHIDDVTRAILE